MGEPDQSAGRQAADLLVKSAAPAADPLVALRAAFERLAERCSETFAELAPVPMVLSFHEVGSCPAGDAQAGFGDTTVIGAFQTPDKGRRILIGADTALVNAALEAVFGADGLEPAGGERPATRIGLRLAGSIFQHVFGELGPSVLGGEAAALEFDRVDTAEKIPAPSRRDELSVLARFELSTLDRAGELFVILPQSALAGVQLGSAKAGAPRAAPAASDTGWSKRIEREVQRTEVTLHAVLDERQLTLGDIAELHVGQVLPLKATPRSDVKVVCEDQTMFWCELGQAEGVYTLRIKDFPDEEQELIDAITAG